MTEPTIEDRHALLKQDRKRQRPALRCVQRIEASAAPTYEDLGRRFISDAESIVQTMVGAMIADRANNEPLLMALTDGEPGPWMVDIRLARCGKDDLT